MISRYMCEVISFSPIKSVACPVPIFMKITNPQQYCVQISYAVFYPKWTVNVQLWTEIYVYTLRKCVVFTTPIFMKLIFTQYIFPDISHTEFDPNKKKYVENMGKIWFFLVYEVWLSLHRLLWNSKFLNSIMWRSSTSNFTQAGHYIWKLLV